MFNKMFECFNSLVTNRNCAKTAKPVSHICSTKCLNVLIPKLPIEIAKAISYIGATKCLNVLIQKLPKKSGNRTLEINYFGIEMSEIAHSIFN